MQPGFGELDRNLLDYALARAKALTSVIEVARDVGYANPSHFACFFRRETGLSPTEYRQQS